MIANSTPRLVRVGIRTLCLSLVLAATLRASAAHAQTAGPLLVFPEEATPIGALPPMALPMPASRDQNYWGFRFQVGQRQERSGPENLLAFAGGIDYQLHGGSIFGFTSGYQRRQNCGSTGSDCRGHALFGLRGRFNVITGGPTLASVVGDESATSTVGTELGLGYAPRVAPGVNACTLDVGVPYSIAMMQSPRVVPFITPGAVWDINCSSSDAPGGRSFLLGFGVGLQQLGMRGLDVNIGAQKTFRRSTGIQLGISVSWVRLP